MKVLVSTDGSEISWVGVSHAARLARVANGELFVVRVLDPLIDVAAVLAVSVREATARTHAEWLAELEAEVERRGITATTRVDILPPRDDVHTAIIRAANDVGADMIAMQSRGRGALRHAILGSVAMGVLGRTPVPLMVTGSKAPAAPVDAESERIAVLCDSTTSAQRIVTAVGDLVAGTRVAVSLGEVVDTRKAKDGTALLAEADARLRALAASLPDSVDVGTFVREQREKTVPDAIIAAAEEVGAQAIGLASHGHGALRHLIAGSVAMDVISRSPLPVILVRG